MKHLKLAAKIQKEIQLNYKTYKLLAIFGKICSGSEKNDIKMIW